MHELDKNKVIAVVLTDIINLSLPRIRTIRTHLDNGGIVAESDLHFIHMEMDKITRCYRVFPEDEACAQIFNNFSHMISEVVQIALDNENKLP